MEKIKLSFAVEIVLQEDIVAMLNLLYKLNARCFIRLKHFVRYGIVAEKQVVYTSAYNTVGNENVVRTGIEHRLFFRKRRSTVPKVRIITNTQQIQKGGHNVRRAGELIHRNRFVRKLGIILTHLLCQVLVVNDKRYFEQVGVVPFRVLILLNILYVAA